MLTQIFFRLILDNAYNMGMILRIASSRIVGQGDIVGRSGYFSLNLSANSVMRGRLDARRTLKRLSCGFEEKLSLRSDYNKNKRNGMITCPMNRLVDFAAGRRDLFPRRRTDPQPCRQNRFSAPLRHEDLKPLNESLPAEQAAELYRSILGTLPLTTFLYDRNKESHRSLPSVFRIHREIPHRVVHRQQYHGLHQ